MPLEVIGTYNPIPIPAAPEDPTNKSKPFKHIELDFHRAKYWLGVGAETSDRVSFLFKRAGLLPDLWPKPSKLSQVVQKAVIKDIEVKYAEPKELVRPRD